MSNPHSPPRRVSLGYILGFSDKPFKEPKPCSPPRPRRPSQLTELVTSHGGIVEWTASDGRKGTLTGTGKPRLTAASLAKVPSNTRSAKHLVTAKDSSKKTASNKHITEKVDAWDTFNSGFAEGNGGSKNPGSKKAPSNKEGTWEAMLCDGGGSIKASQKAASGIAKVTKLTDVTAAEPKQDEKKDEINTVVPVTTCVVKYDTKKSDDLNAWTKEQDEKMLQMKTEDAGIPWRTVAENVGKPMNQCKERWKKIMPQGWNTNDAKKKADEGDASKKAEAKGHDQKGTSRVRESSKGENKKENKDSDDPWLGGLGDITNEKNEDNQNKEKKPDDWNTWNDAGDITTSGWETINAGGVCDVNYDANVNTWENLDGAGDTNNQDNNNTWGEGGGETTTTPWDMDTKQPNDNKSGDTQASNTQDRSSVVKPASVPRSDKASLESRSHHTKTNKSKPDSNSPAEIELEPDDNFSADDLRLIARILQQDCSLVWNRVSWRFRDKMGRVLHPDIFEKKITGTVESKSNDVQNGDRKN